MNEYKTFDELKEEFGEDYDYKFYQMGLSAVKEIERLNNIINEIQTMCKNEYYKKNTTDIDSIGISNNIWVMIYLKIKELKENK